MTSTRTPGRQIVSAFVEHEHFELVAGIDRIHEVAAELPILPADRRSTCVAKVIRWVDETLRPHMAWEESWLFPQIDVQAHTPWLTRLLRFDHRQIVQQADRLRMHQVPFQPGSSSDIILEVFGDLLRLEALLRANLEREEHFLMPLLEGEADGWTAELLA